MQKTAKRENRRPIAASCSMAWTMADGAAESADCRAVDISDRGMRVECGREIPVGIVVLIQGHDIPGRHATVRHCTPFGDKFRIGLEMCPDENFARYSQPRQDDVDFYEALQINAKADADTIHRVYRLMAMRYHPDNPETGDVETFLLLKRAYETLSDPERRAQYDAARDSKESGPLPVFELRDFVEGVQGEINRRLGVLALLYNRRRTDPDHPGISLLDLENRMGFPREYLSFTMWYLRSKFFVDLADNSDFSLTAAGAEYVETNTSSSEPLSKLITGGFWKPARERSDPMHYERPKPQLLTAPATM